MAAWVLAALLLLLVLFVHLLRALFAGLLVYELVHLAAPALSRQLSKHRRRRAADRPGRGVGNRRQIALTVYVQANPDRPAVLLGQFADVLLQAKGMLPQWAAELLPASPGEVTAAVADWARAHAADLQLAGRETGRALIYAILGMIVGAMLALQRELGQPATGPLARELATRAANLSSAFRRVVFAQVRISLINTVFTGIYLVVVLPLLGVDLPLKKTLIVITFVAGLIPVLGNLVSNTFIVVVSLSYSFGVALASLAFLIVIHKLEYFLNARIIGGQIRARAWELLVAILLMEAAFGIPGVIAAPVYYCLLKDELAAQGLV